MSLKIFVAGGTGLVGNAIIKNLKTKGYTNIVSNYHRRRPKDKSIYWNQTDLTNQDEVSDFFNANKPDMVFLAAAKVGGILANDTYPGEFIYQNLMIQNNIIHQAFLQGVQRLLFLGSSCIYPKHAQQPMQEDQLMTGPLEPTNSAYAVAKIAGIEMCQGYNKQYGTSYLPVMPTNLYGNNDNFDLENSHVLPALIRKFHLAKLASQGKYKAIDRDESLFGPIPNDLRFDLGLGSPVKDSKNETMTTKPPYVRLWGTGKPRREFLHVDDLAEACSFLMCKTGETKLTNIGVGKDIAISELAGLVQKIVGFEGQVVFDTNKPDGTPQKLLDNSKLDHLGWWAKIGLEEGIGSVYKWYQEICEERGPWTVDR